MLPVLYTQTGTNHLGFHWCIDGGGGDSYGIPCIASQPTLVS